MHYLVDTQNPTAEIRCLGSIEDTESKYGNKLFTTPEYISQQMQIEIRAESTHPEFSSEYVMEQDAHEEPEKTENTSSDISTENDKWTKAMTETKRIRKNEKKGKLKSILKILRGKNPERDG
ncbi:hypothetical protein JTB14_033474 [Gonioctena quinquepunctata]|nr:hypothetical protein JTB14_033474 [Gonioctena quinquepunctata]